jgi:hypothetical protein
MQKTPLRFVFLTLPTPTEPILNITIGEHHSRYALNRDQLFNLNSQIADALIRGRISDEHAFRDEQLLLDLDSYGTA